MFKQRNKRSKIELNTPPLQETEIKNGRDGPIPVSISLLPAPISDTRHHQTGLRLAEKNDGSEAWYLAYGVVAEAGEEIEWVPEEREEKENPRTRLAGWLLFLLSPPRAL
jgi:hypothetical protein